jgi:ribosome-binding factor A
LLSRPKFFFDTVNVFRFATQARRTFYGRKHFQSSNLCYAEWFTQPWERGIMPEHRARKHHQDRVAEAMRLEIGIMIEGELVDPRIGNCYLSEVALNPGGKSARIYVTVEAPPAEIEKAEEDTIAGLEAAKGYIRYELKERLGVRNVPELTFLADRSERLQGRISELMNRSRKRQRTPVVPQQQVE